MTGTNPLPGRRVKGAHRAAPGGRSIFTIVVEFLKGRGARPRVVDAQLPVGPSALPVSPSAATQRPIEPLSFPPTQPLSLPMTEPLLLPEAELFSSPMTRPLPCADDAAGAAGERDGATGW